MNIAANIIRGNTSTATEKFFLLQGVFLLLHMHHMHAISVRSRNTNDGGVCHFGAQIKDMVILIG
jgi:hypothetical protein